MEGTCEPWGEEEGAQRHGEKLRKVGAFAPAEENRERSHLTQAELPRIDLHRHLEGSLRLQTILELAEQHSLPLPRDLEQLRPAVQVTTTQPDLMAFILKMERARLAFADLDACARIAYESVEDAARDGLAYLELRFSPCFMAQPHGLALAGVVEAVIDGVGRGQRDFGARTNLIGIMSRTFGLESATRELEALLAHRQQIIALDLAGDEIGWPGALFVEQIQRGREAGWQITIHAGEASGPESVWQAVRDLGAARLGHAVHAIQDPALVDFLAARRIGVESSLTSNVQTSTVSDYQHHPLRTFLERGVLATINTDDPGTSGITFTHELTVAAPASGLSQDLIRQAQANALEIAFLSDEEKARLRAAPRPGE
jgi:adenosine deaminase